MLFPVIVIIPQQLLEPRKVCLQHLISLDHLLRIVVTDSILLVDFELSSPNTEHLQGPTSLHVRITNVRRNIQRFTSSNLLSISMLLHDHRLCLIQISTDLLEMQISSLTSFLHLLELHGTHHHCVQPVKHPTECSSLSFLELTLRLSPDRFSVEKKVRILPHLFSCQCADLLKAHLQIFQPQQRETSLQSKMSRNTSNLRGPLTFSSDSLSIGPLSRSTSRTTSGRRNDERQRHSIQRGQSRRHHEGRTVLIHPRSLLKDTLQPASHDV